MAVIRYLALTTALLFTNLINAAIVSVTDAYVRATPPHTQNSVAFMHINNSSDEVIKLLTVSSDIAARVEIHHHEISDGMMKMRQVDDLDIKANDSIKLRPGGLHVMLLGLKSPLTEGENIKLKLYFNNGDEIVVETPVIKITTQK
jgi:copper(I)-binding protein